MEETWFQIRAINLAGHKDGWLSWEIGDDSLPTDRPFRYDSRHDAVKALATFTNLAPGWSGRVVRIDRTTTERDPEAS